MKSWHKTKLCSFHAINSELKKNVSWLKIIKYLDTNLGKTRQAFSISVKQFSVKLKWMMTTGVYCHTWGKH